MSRVVTGQAPGGGEQGDRLLVCVPLAVLLCNRDVTAGWWLGCGTHQEEAEGGSLLRPDVADRRSAEEDAPNRTQHVLSC